MTIKMIFIAAVAIIFISWLLSLYIFRRKQEATKAFLDHGFIHAIPDAGYEIPILQSYSGLKALTPVTFIGNNLNPRLVFYPDHLSYKVLFKRDAAYADIIRMQGFRSRYFNRLRLSFRGKAWFFMAVFGSEEALQAAIHILAEKGVPLDDQR